MNKRLHKIHKQIKSLKNELEINLAPVGLEYCKQLASTVNVENPITKAKACRAATSYILMSYQLHELEGDIPVFTVPYEIDCKDFHLLIVLIHGTTQDTGLEALEDSVTCSLEIKPFGKGINNPYLQQVLRAIKEATVRAESTTYLSFPYAPSEEIFFEFILQGFVPKMINNHSFMVLNHRAYKKHLQKQIDALQEEL